LALTIISTVEVGHAFGFGNVPPPPPAAAPSHSGLLGVGGCHWCCWCCWCCFCFCFRTTLRSWRSFLLNSLSSAGDAAEPINFSFGSLLAKMFRHLSDRLHFADFITNIILRSSCRRAAPCFLKKLERGFIQSATPQRLVRFERRLVQ
jgi:hypothetical protein